MYSRAVSVPGLTDSTPAQRAKLAELAFEAAATFAREAARRHHETGALLHQGLPPYEPDTL
jgi:hypothetical protein